MNCSGSVMKVLMIVMMFQDEITTGRKSNLCWRCLYYVTTNDCSNDTPVGLQTLSCASKSLFCFIVDDGPPPLSPLSPQQIAKTLLKWSPVIREVIQWQELWLWCHPQWSVWHFFVAPYGNTSRLIGNIHFSQIKLIRYSWSKIYMLIVHGRKAPQSNINLI